MLGGCLTVHNLVSIHAPVQGATQWVYTCYLSEFSFYPRPRAGGDLRVALRPRGETGFYPRPRAGGDLGGCLTVHNLEAFLSTPPCRGRQCATKSRA